jgi:hypothetical protein
MKLITLKACKSKMKNIFLAFIFAFVTNAVWENLHSFLYLHYKDGPITETILLRASFWDAVIIILMIAPFIYFDSLKKRTWFIAVIGVVVALIIEWHALGTGRWAYNSLMPIVPFLNTGLTPTIQLGLLGYVAYKFHKYLLH